MSYEEDLEFANKILRFRDAALSGRLFKDNAFKMTAYDEENIEISFDHNGGVGNAVIAYFKVDNNLSISYFGNARFIINQDATDYTTMGDDYTIYTVDTPEQSELSEEWYFQQSLIHQSERGLTGAVVLKTLLSNTMKDFNILIFMPYWLDKIIKRMDIMGIA